MGHKDNGLALSKLDISTSKIAFCIIYHGYREGGAWDRQVGGMGWVLHRQTWHSVTPPIYNPELCEDFLCSVNSQYI